MRVDLYRLLKHLHHVLWIAVWLAASILLWRWTTVGATVFLCLGCILYLWALKRGVFKIRQQAQRDQGPTELEAKYMVTQVLRNLTRVQVAYLCQDFKSRSEARSWLKQALPRGYRQNLDILLENLEAERTGDGVDGMNLPRQILKLRQPLLQMVDALNEAHKTLPEHVIANPVIFVITENISVQDAEPLVVTLAGWNPSKPTLLPRVDALTFFSEIDGQRSIRGQTDFDGALEALKQNLNPLEGEPQIYAAEPIDDPVQHGVKLSKVPLGFVIGAAELV